MVKRADIFINLCNCASIVGQTSICILIFYSLIWYQSAFAGSHMLVFMSVFWLVWDLLGMTMTAAGGILVNNAVSHKIVVLSFLVFKAVKHIKSHRPMLNAYLRLWQTFQISSILLRYRIQDYWGNMHLWQKKGDSGLNWQPGNT